MKLLKLSNTAKGAAASLQKAARFTTGTVNSTKREITFANGGVIRFRGLDEGLEQYRGLTFDAMFLDDVELLAGEEWVLRARVRPA